MRNAFNYEYLNKIYKCLKLIETKMTLKALKT